MKRLLRLLCALLIIVIAAAGGFLYLMYKDPNPLRPARIEEAGGESSGFVQAAGTNLYDGEGDLLRLKGVNLGNWFIQEIWMGICSVGDFDTGIYTQRRAEAAMRANPNLTEEEIRSLDEMYLDNYIQEEDFKILADLGMNAVRIPFTCYNLTTDGYTLKENAFEKLDWAVDMCAKYGLYAIIDLHGAYGSQNQDLHSGDDAHFDLYGNEENELRACELWREIARHFKDNQTVAAYDLLNEPRRAPGKFGGKLNFDFYDKLYHVVREEDGNHMILIECFSFPVNGARLSGYDWDNICMEYHIYNLSRFSQRTCLNFYRALHNLMGYKTPVCVGEWNAFEKESEWEDSFAWFDEQGWSFLSWNYKANAYAYDTLFHNYCNWGLYNLYIEPVDLSTADYEEIANVFSGLGTANAKRTVVYDYWEQYLKEK